MVNKDEILLVIGGSDAGISAALKAKELKPNLKVQVLLADEFPNLSICGLPYAVSGEVENWHSLAHRSLKELEDTGIEFHMNTVVKKIQSREHFVVARLNDDTIQKYYYDKLVVATGAVPKLDSLAGLNLKRIEQKNSRIHVLHTMDDYFAIENELTSNSIKNIAIVGAGYIGIEMAEALQRRQLNVTIFQRGSEVLSTVDLDLGKIIHKKLVSNGIKVLTDLTVSEIKENKTTVDIIGTDMRENNNVFSFDLALIVIGVKPNTDILVEAGAKTGVNGAIKVDNYMQTTLPDIWAAGDLVETKHLLLDWTYLPLGTTSHKQGRIAGFNVAGVPRSYKGSIGTQVLKVYDLVVARTGLLEKEAMNVGFTPLTVTTDVDDHKAYFPGSNRIKIKLTGDENTGKLLGAQLVGKYGSEVAKRNDIFATAIYNDMTVSNINDLDLSYSPPVGSPWDAIQLAAQNWEKNAFKK